MCRIFWFRGVRLVSVLAFLVCPAIGRADGLNGAQIYQQQCARCHGVDGEGTKKDYPQPLAGKRSVPRLARYIAKSMPDDKPGTLSQADADKVAAYIFDTFYSPAAQARQKPPRIELARLTVRQYRNATMDLIAGFRPPAPSVQDGAGTGFGGAYFKGKFRGNQKGNPAFTRLDPIIRADLSAGSPDANKLDAAEFTVRWEGSLMAPDTGDYEFLIHTDQSSKLWINDTKQPLVDASVKSGNDTEYRGSVYLCRGPLVSCAAGVLSQHSGRRQE